MNYTSDISMEEKADIILKNFSINELGPYYFGTMAISFMIDEYIVRP